MDAPEAPALSTSATPELGADAQPFPGRRKALTIGAVCKLLEDNDVGVVRTRLTTAIPDLELFDTLRG